LRFSYIEEMRRRVYAHDWSYFHIWRGDLKLSYPNIGLPKKYKVDKEFFNRIDEKSKW